MCQRYWIYVARSLLFDGVVRFVDVFKRQIHGVDDRENDKRLDIYVSKSEIFSLRRPHVSAFETAHTLYSPVPCQNHAMCTMPPRALIYSGVRSKGNHF